MDVDALGKLLLQQGLGEQSAALAQKLATGIAGLPMPTAASGGGPAAGATPGAASKAPKLEDVHAFADSTQSIDDSAGEEELRASLESVWSSELAAELPKDLPGLRVAVTRAA